MSNSFRYTIRAVEEQDRELVLDLTKTLWGDGYVVVDRIAYYPDQLDGFLAWNPASEVVGLITYQISGKNCEIITLNSLVQNQGVGSNLIDCVLEQARINGCGRVCLTTTNDNQQAVAFFKNLGFRLSEIRKDAVEKSRSLKPSIPTISAEGIPIRDEWEYELILPPGSKG